MTILEIFSSLYIAYFLLNVLNSNEYLYGFYSELCIRTMCIKHIYSYVYQPQCMHLLSRFYALFYLRIHFTFEHK